MQYSVSYTHLDVYKRQSYNPPMACYTTTKARPFSVNVNLSPLATILPDSMKKISGKENSPAQSDNQ